MTHTILNAEPYSPAHLMQALAFTTDDLSLNQVGQLSKTQHRELEQGKRISIGCSLGCLIFCVPVIFMILAMTADDTGPSRIGILGLAMLMPVGFICLCISAVIGLSSDLASNRVYSITGPITKRTSTSKNSTTYTVSIWSRTFNVSKQAFEAFSGGWVYTLYFASSSSLLLSAEFISDKPITEAPQPYLNWALRINEKDLAANAAGEMSEAQRRTFESTSQSYWLNLIGFALLLGLMLTVGFSIWWPEGSLRLAVIVLLGGLGVLGYFVASTMKANQRAHVAAVRGRIERSDSALAVNGDRLFRVGALASAFVSGQTYTIYYVPLKTGLFDHYDPIVAAVHHPDEAAS